MMTFPFNRAWLALGAGLAISAPAAAEVPAEFSAYSETLMWRLDPPTGGAPSYAVGTIHMVDERLQPALDRALARLDEAGALVVEVDISDAAQLDLMGAMLLTDGRTLTDIIGAYAYDRLAASAKSYGVLELLLSERLPWAAALTEIGGAYQFARLTAIAEDYGIPGLLLNKMAPWGAAVTISIPAEQLHKMAAGLPVFDQALVNAAEAAGLPIETLESIDEQIAAMSGAPEPDQAEMLVHAIDMHPRLEDLIGGMVDLYVADDLRGLAEMMVAEMDVGDPELTARAYDALVTDRNHRMAERVTPLLAERPHLVAIGAMHLPGEDGVLNLLAEQGWTVTPMP